MLPAIPTSAPKYPLLSDAKFKALAEDYDTNSFRPEQIEIELNENMAVALKGLEQHQRYVDTLAAVGKQTLAQAKEAVKKAENGSQADKEAAVKVAFNAQKLIIKMADLAHQDHQAFDGAWNVFRALSVDQLAPKLPDTHKAKFIRAREKIMGDGKLINVKVAKLKQFTTQADALTKFSGHLATAGRNQPSQADAQAAADKLEAAFTDQMMKSMGSVKRGLNGGKNIGWHSVETKMAQLRTNAKLAKVPQKTFDVMENYHTNMVAAVKTYKSTVKTMDTLGATTLKTIPAPLQKVQPVAATLATAKGMRDEAVAMRDLAIKTLAEADKLMAKMKKNVG